MVKKKAKKKEEVAAKEVSRLEFIDLIKIQIELAKRAIAREEKVIDSAEEAIASYVELYKKVELDKCRYNVKYYVVGDGLTYERTSLKKIGFGG